MDQNRKRNSQAGFSLLLLTLTMTVMLAMLGLTLDLGRMYIVRNELQAYVDEAAIAAAFELDGSTDGIARATEVATSGIGTANQANLYYFGTRPVTNVTTEFSTYSNGTYYADPGTGQGIQFVRVTASGNVQLYLLPVLPNVGSHQTIATRAVAGQGLRTQGLGEGGSPFSPDAHDLTDPNFGYAPGQLYTLKWAPPGQRKKAGGRCAGDLDFDPGGGSSDRGYIDVGQGNGNSGLHDAIVNGGYFLDTPLQVGSSINHVNGNKHVSPAMETRYYQDTDTVSQTWANYHGNGRRVMILPINDSQSPARVVGFGTFFLPQTACGTKNSVPCCGIYVGPSPVLHSKVNSPGSPGLYEVKLYQ